MTHKHGDESLTEKEEYKISKKDYDAALAIEQRLVDSTLLRIESEVANIRAGKIYYFDHMYELAMGLALSLKKMDTLKMYLR